MLRPALACVRYIEDAQRYSIIGSSNNSLNIVSAINGYTLKNQRARIGIAGHVSRPSQPSCLLFLFLRPAWSHESGRGMFERAVLRKFGKRMKYTQFLESHDLKVVLQRIQLIEYMLLVPGIIVCIQARIISITDSKGAVFACLFLRFNGAHTTGALAVDDAAAVGPSICSCHSARIDSEERRI